MKETYSDIEFTAVYDYKPGNSHVDFKVYEIVANESDDDKNYDVPVYEGIGGCGCDDKSTRNVEEANTYLYGSVKWDGCSHFYFGAEKDGDGYLHLCGKRCIKNHLAIVERVYLRCGTFMETADKSEFALKEK